MWHPSTFSPECHAGARSGLAAFFRGAVLVGSGWWEGAHGGVMDEYRLFRGVLRDGKGATSIDSKIHMVRLNECSELRARHSASGLSWAGPEKETSWPAQLMLRETICFPLCLSPCLASPSPCRSPGLGPVCRPGQKSQFHRQRDCVSRHDALQFLPVELENIGVR
jgi:hypothetical protein